MWWPKKSNQFWTLLRNWLTCCCVCKVSNLMLCIFSCTTFMILPMLELLWQQLWFEHFNLKSKYIDVKRICLIFLICMLVFYSNFSVGIFLWPVDSFKNQPENFIGYILEISWTLLKTRRSIYRAYLLHVYDILWTHLEESWAGLGHILGLYWSYLRNVFGLSWAYVYFRHILCIS